MMSRKWKAALAPWLAGIPLRTGFAGELRFGLINDMRHGESLLPRMIDQMGALALPKDAKLPSEWPLPELKVPARDVDAWCMQAKTFGRSADRHAVTGRGRRRQSLAARTLRRIGPRARQRGRIDLGFGRTQRKNDRKANRRRWRSARTRSHEQRFTQRHSRARRRRRLRHQRFRIDACVGCDRNAHGRNFWTDQPVASEAAQSDSRYCRAAWR